MGVAQFCNIVIPWLVESVQIEVWTHEWIWDDIQPELQRGVPTKWWCVGKEIRARQSPFECVRHFVEHESCDDLSDDGHSRVLNREHGMISIYRLSRFICSHMSIAIETLNSTNQPYIHRSLGDITEPPAGSLWASTWVRDRSVTWNTRSLKRFWVRPNLHALQ